MNGIDTTRTEQTRNKAVVALTTGLEDAERVTVAFLVAVAAAESGRPTLMFLTQEAVCLTQRGGMEGVVGCEGCPPLADLAARYLAAGGRYLICPLCFAAKHLDRAEVVGNAEIGGTVPMWEWIGDDPTVSFSY
ncbi:peroxiredoxin [Rhodococcus sp. NPDC127528]|uniref:peroxiredoxin n=1 Tax=unclassified Rhodococcus (in: high G+C Gram-positive bacteria) TaxID=192944 RepID=UPI00362D09B6